MGRCDVMLGGGTEAPLSPLGIAGFANMTALSRSGVSMPFDVARDGFVIGEGAGVLVLEERARALARGAYIYAELAGAASTADAHHMTAPSPDGSGAARCMELAMADAMLSPADVAHVNTHGTSTPPGDAAEAEAIFKVFGAPGPPPPLSRASSATHWQLPARSRQSRLLSASGTGRSLPPSVQITWTPHSISTWSQGGPETGSRGRSCQTRLASAGTMAASCWYLGRARQPRPGPQTAPT